MTAREEIKALREEVAQLHKDIEALTAAMLQLAVNTPQPWYYPVPYVAPQLQPVWPWPQYPYIITYGDSSWSGNPGMGM